MPHSEKSRLAALLDVGRAPAGQGQFRAGLQRALEALREAKGGLWRRRTLAVFVAATSLLSAASFDSAQAASIGLYVDDIHVQNCVPWPRFNARYTVWSWCSSSADGVQGACFAVLWSGNLFRGPVQINPAVVDHYAGTNFMTGLTFYYNSCRYDWHWIHKEDVTEVTPPGQLYIEEGVLEHAGMVRTCR